MIHVLYNRFFYLFKGPRENPLREPAGLRGGECKRLSVGGGREYTGMQSDFYRSAPISQLKNEYL